MFLLTLLLVITTLNAGLVEEKVVVHLDKMTYTTKLDE